jgi:tetratricopeptide (TPR) repeat protein
MTARSDRQETVIELYEESLSGISQNERPLEWAYVQFKLGVAYVDRERGNRSDNVDRAITHYERALEVMGDRQVEDTEILYQNLGAVYAERLSGDPRENLEKSIDYLSRALELLQSSRDVARRVAVLNNLANSYCLRLEGRHATNIERAIDCAGRALEMCSLESSPKDWAELQHALGVAFQNRIYGDRTDNIELSIHHLGKALEAMGSLSARHRWSANNNIGTAYLRRFLGPQLRNVELSLQHFHAALQNCLREENGDDWAMTQLNLSGAYRLASNVPDHLDSSLEHAGMALEFFRREVTPVKWAMVQLGVAASYGERGDLDRMAAHTEVALEVFSRDQFRENWALAHLNLGISLARGEHIVEAIYHLREALSIYTIGDFPAQHARASRVLADMHLNAGDYASARDALVSATAAGEELLRSAYTESGRHTEIDADSNSYAELAYCSLKLARYEDAVIELDRGKARLLAEAVANEAGLRANLSAEDQRALEKLQQTINELEAEQRLPPQTPARRKERELSDELRQTRRSLADLLAAAGADPLQHSVDLQTLLSLVPRGGFVLAPLVTRLGSAVFVLKHGMESVEENHIVWLDALKYSDVVGFLFGPESWFGAYVRRREQFGKWLAMIETAGTWLWEHLMCAVDQYLRSFGAASGAPLVVLPQAGLGVLPWHAAWRLDGNVRRYVIDDYTLYYAPGAYALNVSARRQREPARKGTRFLGIADPRGDLPAAAAEGELISGNFPAGERTCLEHDAASRDAVLARADGANYLHFCCHGIYDPQAPFRSGLLLAAGETLTLSEVMSRVRLSRASLVSLSACETGMIELRTRPDEFLGLPAAFHQAGAPAVSSTLWAVDDLVTMLLMEQFYRAHRGRGLAPPAAMREAQLWLRKATNLSLADQMSEFKTLQNCPATSALARRLFREFTLAPVHVPPPFAHPFYWAAFVFSGAAPEVENL